MAKRKSFRDSGDEHEKRYADLVTIATRRAHDARVALFTDACGQALTHLTKGREVLGAAKAHVASAKRSKLTVPKNPDDDRSFEIAEKSLNKTEELFRGRCVVKKR